MLILFDIDATLISTSGVGMRSMVAAGQRLFGPHFHAEGVDFAGRLDPLIIHDMFKLAGVDDTPNHRARFRAAYREEISAALARPGAGRALPGVPALLARLRARPEICLGLLTGNFAETGRLKLQACGIDPEQFAVCVWGDESPHTPPQRTHLPAVGLDRYHSRHGRSCRAEHATIVGDTPHDVAAAKAHGLRCLAVATGAYNVDDLRSAGADHAVPDLSSTEEILTWLLSPNPPTS